MRRSITLDGSLGPFSEKQFVGFVCMLIANVGNIMFLKCLQIKSLAGLSHPHAWDGSLVLVLISKTRHNSHQNLPKRILSPVHSLNVTKLMQQNVLDCFTCVHILNK